MTDLHLRALRQAARARRRQVRTAEQAAAPQGSAGRLRQAEDARARADAQSAVASASRNLAKRSGPAVND
jgi:hypothetical protein